MNCLCKFAIQTEVPSHEAALQSLKFRRSTQSLAKSFQIRKLKLNRPLASCVIDLDGIKFCNNNSFLLQVAFTLLVNDWQTRYQN